MSECHPTGIFLSTHLASASTPITDAFARNSTRPLFRDGIHIHPPPLHFQRTPAFNLGSGDDDCRALSIRITFDFAGRLARVCPSPAFVVARAESLRGEREMRPQRVFTSDSCSSQVPEAFTKSHPARRNRDVNHSCKNVRSRNFRCCSRDVQTLSLEIPRRIRFSSSTICRGNYVIIGQISRLSRRRCVSQQTTVHLDCFHGLFCERERRRCTVLNKKERSALTPTFRRVTKRDTRCCGCLQSTRRALTSLVREKSGLSSRRSLSSGACKIFDTTCNIFAQRCIFEY